LFQLFIIFLLAFGKSKTGWSKKRGAEKLMKIYFQLLIFGAIQFLDLLKANKKMKKSWKQTLLVFPGLDW
jgi:hypothetical protein